MFADRSVDQGRNVQGKIMSYFREMIFGQQVEAPKPLVRTPFILLLSITVLFAFYHYGMVAFMVSVLGNIAVAIWNAICDLATSLADFLQYISSQGHA
jgi:hypothetical protein